MITTISFCHYVIVIVLLHAVDDDDTRMTMIRSISQNDVIITLITCVYARVWGSAFARVSNLCKFRSRTMTNAIEICIINVIFFCWVYLFKFGTSYGWMNFCWLSWFDWLLIEFDLLWFLWHVQQDCTTKTNSKFAMTAIFRQAHLSLNDCLFIWVFDCS